MGGSLSGFFLFLFFLNKISIDGIPVIKCTFERDKLSPGRIPSFKMEIRTSFCHCLLLSGVGLVNLLGFHVDFFLFSLRLIGRVWRNQKAVSRCSDELLANQESLTILP